MNFRIITKKYAAVPEKGSPRHRFSSGLDSRVQSDSVGDQLQFTELNLNSPNQVYRQLGDSNSQWHKKKVQKSASWGTRASWGTKFNPWTDDFFQIL